MRHASIRSDQEQGCRLLYASYKHEAGERGLLFALTWDEFSIFQREECAYCGDEPNDRTTLRRGKLLYYKANGIDRVNSNSGYCLDNCVPCCYTCNMMKRDLSFNKFLNQIRKIARYTKGGII